MRRIVINKNILFLMIVSILFSLSACDNGGDNSTTISNSDSHDNKIIVFTEEIKHSFTSNDIDAFKKIVDGDSLTVINGYGGMGVVETVSIRKLDNLQINNGELLTKNDPEVDPPEQKLGLSADLFSKDKPSICRYEKEGLLEHVDWHSVNYDYLTAHFNAFYGQMLWMCANESEEDGWVVYHLCDDTFLFSNSYAWYSEDWQARVLVGQTFVIKRINNQYKIVAFIDVK